MEPTSWRSTASNEKILLLDIVPTATGIAVLIINEKRRLDIVSLEKFQRRYLFCGIGKRA